MMKMVRSKWLSIFTWAIYVAMVVIVVYTQLALIFFPVLIFLMLVRGIKELQKAQTQGTSLFWLKQPNLIFALSLSMGTVVTFLIKNIFNPGNSSLISGLFACCVVLFAGFFIYGSILSAAEIERNNNVEASVKKLYDNPRMVFFSRLRPWFGWLGLGLLLSGLLLNVSGSSYGAVIGKFGGVLIAIALFWKLILEIIIEIVRE